MPGSAFVDVTALLELADEVGALVDRRGEDSQQNGDGHARQRDEAPTNRA